MIPYDDLVVALATWRARQGLPVGALSGALAPPPVIAAAPPPVIAPRAPSPTALRARSGPTTPPPRGNVSTPPPLEIIDSHEDSLDVDESALIEETQYDNEGEDFAMSFAQRQAAAAESTAIGALPESGDSFGGATQLGLDAEIENDLPPPPRGRNEDW